MAKAKSKKGRNPNTHGEQTFIEGTGPVKNEKIHALALRYMKERDARMAKNRDEKEAHTALLDAMTAEKLEVYEYDNVKVFVDSQKKCKVSNETSAPAGDDDEE